jgi:hypothetical protein
MYLCTVSATAFFSSQKIQKSKLSFFFNPKQGSWVCTVSATAYLDRVVFSDALESKAANLSVFGK